MNELTILQIGTAGTPVKKGAGIGGAEKVLSCLDKEFVRKGYCSIVAAPGDSEVYGRLLPTLEKSFNGSNDSPAYEEHYGKIVEFLLSDGGLKVDIIHDHPGRGFVNSKDYSKNIKKIRKPVLITNHGSQLPGLPSNHERLKELMKTNPIYLNAISRWQKEKLERENEISVAETIYHGIPLEIFEYSGNIGEYLFLLGRICRQKSQHIAIEVAKKTGNKLVLGGSIEDRLYFEEEIKPQIDGEQIQYVGPLNDSQKTGFYKNAKAFLMPITGPETFSLVTAEALASGTPAIVFNFGAVSEIVQNRISGYVIQQRIKNGILDIEGMKEEMIERVNAIDLIQRADCRKRIEENFTLEKQAENYINLYKRIISKK